MDYDTTRTKDSYENILQAFANQQADILIGTQMIVKGHDFPNVTLVGILAADMSLHVIDYHGAERTFQLVTQAAGRAGRGELKGQVVIQTYSPEHFAILTAIDQNYEAFYEQEIVYRQMLHYPPAWNLMVILASSKQEEELTYACHMISKEIGRRLEIGKVPVQMIGPADAQIAKISDVYRKVIYLKTKDYQTLVQIKDWSERFIKDKKAFYNVSIQFDFIPMSGF